MTQRKLTDDEMDNVMVARCALRKIRQSFDSPDCLRDTAIHLRQLALHATTDGNPYVDPEPPIPDGYRKAVAGDEGRRDCKVWENAWVQRHFVGEQFNKINHYIVPVDRVPTDEDAKCRPEVMVRHSDDCKWQKYTLLAVFASRPEIRFMCLYDNGSTYATWKQCRHLYPGE